MTTTTAASEHSARTSTPSPAGTIPALFLDRIQSTPRTLALRHKKAGQWVDFTWEDYATAVREIARGLALLGVEPGDRVGLHSNTCVEWVFTDVGIMCAGAVTVPVYPTCTAEDTTFILNHAAVKVVIAETPEDAEKIRSRPDTFDPRTPIVLFTGKPTGENDLSLDQLRERGREGSDDPIEKTAESTRSEDTATIVYTSGTTGKPKGACLTHANLFGECEGLSEVLAFTPEDVTLSFLPLAHIFARMIHVLGIHRGYTTAYAESINTVVENIAEIHPTFMGSVPRVFEKIYARIKGGLDKAPTLRRTLAHWALGVGQRLYEADRDGREPAPIDTLTHPIAQKLVLTKLREKVFGPRMRYLVSGGAPMPVGIASFFAAMGVKIVEGYGLTETTAATHVNPVDNIRLGYVGVPIKGVEHRLADDGEIQLRGSVVMKSYYQNDEANASAFDDGWFCTGDIGEISEGGWLKITDRKKEIIVTSAGKNIAPQKIEGVMKTSSLISQIMVYGDQKNFLTALISLNLPEVKAELQRRKLPVPNGELSQDEGVRELIEKALGERNEQLARYETIKKFVLTDTELTPENGYLTPTLKLKRREIIKTFGPQLDALYES